MLWLEPPSFAQNFSSLSVLPQVCFTKIIMTFYYILVCSDMAYDKYKSIKKHMLHLCRITRKDDVAKWLKKWSQICLTFNKIAPAKDTLCKLDKQRFLSGSILGVKQSERPVKNTDVMLI
jgi:hypothetical protein